MGNLAFRIGGNPYPMTGIHRYSKNIIKNIVEKDTDNNYMLLDTNCYGLEIDSCVFPVNKNNSDEIIALQVNMLECNAIISFFDPCLHSIKGDIKEIFNINDLIPIVFSGCHDDSDYWRSWPERMRKSALSSDLIIAISECTKRDIIKCFEVPEDKIKVIYPACDMNICCNQESGITDKELQDKFMIKDEYILSVCTLEPRKNLVGLLKAFNLYKSLKKCSKLQLVLTGTIGWMTDEIFSEYNNSPYKTDIILTGYVSDMELLKLYQNALAVAYVSKYEGFGLPILEGMSMKKAVISSNTSSMPEVGGDAVCYCNPYEVESIEEAIKKVCEDEEYRILLEQKGAQRAKYFSYAESAEKIIELYKKLQRG